MVLALWQHIVVYLVLQFHWISIMSFSTLQHFPRALTHRFRPSAFTSTPNPFQLSPMRLLATQAEEVTSLKQRIQTQAEVVRSLKSNKSPNNAEAIKSAVADLLHLKTKFERITGQPYDQGTKKSSSKSTSSNTQNLTSNSNSPPTKATTSISDTSELVITPRVVDYSAWYADIIAAAGLVDSSPVRGCMVLKPDGMALWDLIRTKLDRSISQTGTRNAYFPLFIPKSFLAKEAEHVEGFAKECAVVTHHRLKLTDDRSDLIPDPDSVLEEPLIVRPTSETMIWSMFQQWIRSYRDLPLKVNQWANVVRYSSAFIA